MSLKAVLRGQKRKDKQLKKQRSTFPLIIQKKAHILVLVALSETGSQPLQTCLALFWSPYETLGGHLVGYNGENVSSSVDSSQLLLHSVFTPRVDECQRL